MWPFSIHFLLAKVRQISRQSTCVLAQFGHTEGSLFGLCHRDFYCGNRPMNVATL